MPWQQGGGSGGPWGSSGGSGSGGSGGGGGGNNGGPWGRGGGGGGPGGGGGGGNGPFGGGGRRPDNLEDLIRRGQDRVKRYMPSGGLGGKGLILGIVVLLGLWLATGFYRVEPGEQGVVLRFGQWTNENNLAGPGLHWHLPWPIETAETPNVEVERQIDIGFVSTGTSRTAKREVPEESLMLTGDQNIIDIEFTVLWRVKDAGDFLFNIRDPEVTIKAVAESAMREIIGRTDIQPALTEARDEVAAQTAELMQAILDEYQSGILINGIQLQDAQAPQPVIDAFEDVQRAQQDRDRARNEAEAYRNKVVPEARGFAARAVQEAEAYREQVVKEAEGEAQRFLSVLTEYQQAPELTKRRLYLETLQTVLSETQKMVLDPSLQGTVPYLPLNELRSRGQSN